MAGCRCVGACGVGTRLWGGGIAHIVLSRLTPLLPSILLGLYEMLRMKDRTTSNQQGEGKEEKRNGEQTKN